MLQLLTACLAAKPPPPANFAQQSVASMVKAPVPPRNPQTGYAKVAAAAVAPLALPTTPSTSASNATAVPSTPSVTTTSSSAALDQQSAVTSSPSLTHPSITSPMLSSASLSHRPDDSLHSAYGSPALLNTVPSAIGGPAATSSPQRQTARKGGYRTTRRLATSPALMTYIHSVSTLTHVAAATWHPCACLPCRTRVSLHVSPTHPP